MLKKDNFKKLLNYLYFNENSSIFTKSIDNNDLKVDFNTQEIIYPEDKGLTVNERQTCNFASNENFVVFECVHRLLEKGYKPEHIELEPKWRLGHGASGGRADILVKNQEKKHLLIIECKTAGGEFDKAWRQTKEDGDQLFSYAQQISETQYLCLYASDFKNGEINLQQRIISLKDNEEILKQDDKLKSFAKASNVPQRFEVWKDTYQLEYTQGGIFEDNIQPYQIGKNKYTLDDDTRPVTDDDIAGKYHCFRTILRQHNIARKETAFEVLVNLFLAKIVDEEENKNNLEFYWKGIAYDNYYDFIDRLQKLYQIGMRKFLKDEVMYISDTQIDEAFWTVKNKRNATKKQIQEYFRKLKFFSNNAFSLINVHNERLFKQNTKVLVEIVQMWQGLRLKTNEQNQFLGDMFEYFLDNSIKQSEGQFFTPMPITKFIVASLPLADKIKNASEPLKAIDFACGAGHFLTEYAHQIKPLVETYKKTDIGRYFENIVGIEKEDRLAKIAKVSAYMYGQEQIKILEKDALGDVADMEYASFNVLVANPPFAVEGFLLNLDDKQKQLYNLTETTKSNSNTSNIQCFFIERAKQLMSPDGVVGIIVPSSVLSNSDATHIGAREIILKYFDIISIVELGSGTFGKTDTNTVVLFLRRKKQKPESAEHYQNRVEDYFEGIQEGDPSTAEYQDSYLIKKYCEHTELPYGEYTKLLGITTDTIADLDELLKTDVFSDYKTDFENSIEIKNWKKKKTFKSKPQKEQAEEINKRLIKYLYAIEKDKLLYFMLAYESEQKVLIVKSPNDKKDQKQFLGYWWSNAKGSEGIKYNGGSTVNEIITPLFDPKNTNNEEKINYLIQQNFLGAKPNDLKDFEQYKKLIIYANVADILDFSRKDFNKSFSLSPKKNISIDTKWELVKISDFIYTVESGNRPKGGVGNFFDGAWSLGGEHIHAINGKVDLSTPKYVPLYFFEKSNKGILKENDILLCKDGALTGKIALLRNELSNKKAMINEHVFLIRCNNIIKQKYLFNFLLSENGQGLLKLNITGSAQGGLNSTNLKEIKIPLPPIKVQQKIVSECEYVDAETEQAHQIIKNTRKEIEEKVQSCLNSGYALKELTSVAIFNPSKSEIRNVKNNEIVSFIDMPSVSENGFIAKKIDKPLGELRKGSYTYFKEKDIIIAKITPCMENGKCAIATSLTNNLAMGSSEFHVIRVKDSIDERFLFVLLNRKSVRDEAKKNMTGSSGHRRVPKSFYENYLIPLPPLNIQKQIVVEIEKLEKIIAQYQEIIEASGARKNEILEKYL